MHRKKINFWNLNDHFGILMRTSNEGAIIIPSGKDTKTPCFSTCKITDFKHFSQIDRDKIAARLLSLLYIFSENNHILLYLVGKILLWKKIKQYFFSFLGWDYFYLNTDSSFKVLLNKCTTKSMAIFWLEESSFTLYPIWTAQTELS